MLIGREARQGLQPPPKIGGRDEVIEVPAQLFVTVVVVALDGGVLDRSVHPLDLYVRPWMVELGEAVLDAALPSAHGEHVGHVSRRRSVGVARRIAELDAIVGQDRVDLVGDSSDEGDQEV